MPRLGPVVHYAAWACAALLLPVSHVSAAGVNIYIAPGGNDRWTGHLAEPNAARTDGPLATPNAARDVVRKLKQAAGGRLAGPVTITLRGGIYALKSPLVLTTDDSGTVESPVTWAALGTERPVLSAGCRVTNWRVERIAERDVWVADLQPEVRRAGRFQSLWVNGRRAIRARHPNQGYLRVVGVPDRNPQTAWHEGQSRFELSAGTLPKGATLVGADAVTTALWADWRLPVVSYDPARRLVVCDRKSGFALQAGDLAYFEGSLDALDAAGEWALDASGARLLYLPLPSEKISESEVIAPVLDRVLALEGVQAQGKYVDHVRFQGLTFSHSEWRLPAGQSGFAQGAFGVPAAVYATGARYCEWANCEISHIGQFGFEVYNGCCENRLVHCHLYDLGAGAVKLGDGTWSNTVAECRIHDGGKTFHGAAAVLSMESFGDRITGNTISDFYYTGIALGWTWGYGANKAKNILVEDNRIAWLGKLSTGDGPILNELGGVYVLGKQPGTIIRGNVIEHVEGRRSNWQNVPSGLGLYLDEGPSYLLIENNIIRDCDINFHQHYGRENIVRHNILAFPRVAQLSRVRQEPHLSFTITNNIFLAERNSVLLFGNWGDSQFAFDYNLYWRTDGSELRFSNMTFANWRARGRDAHSQVVDPQFVDAIHGDFRLKADSPARQAPVGPPAIRATAKRIR